MAIGTVRKHWHATQRWFVQTKPCPRRSHEQLWQESIQEQTAYVFMGITWDNPSLPVALSIEKNAHHHTTAWETEAWHMLRTAGLPWILINKTPYHNGWIQRTWAHQATGGPARVTHHRPATTAARPTEGQEEHGALQKFAQLRGNAQQSHGSLEKEGQPNHLTETQPGFSWFLKQGTPKLNGWFITI